jgi:glycosyltransferase involved in cell wall biosynthesis
MKVLMSTDSLGGVWSYSLDLTRSLRRHGIEVVLAVLGGELDREQRARARSCGAVAVAECGRRLEWMDDPWGDVETSGRWLQELAEEHEVDLVHLCSYAHAALPWRQPTLLVAHADVLSWWRHVRGEPAPASWDRYREEAIEGLAAADAVVAPTSAALNDLQASFGFPAARGLVIPHGSGTPAVEQPGPRDELVLAAGRLWDVAKGLDVLDRAADGLAWQVCAAGDLGRADVRHVHALGRLRPDRLAALRGRAAIFAAPASYEPFGLAALEAARSGCALVLGDVPSLREVWGDTATYVDPHDSEELHSCLAKLIAAPERRDYMARRALRRSRRFSVATMGRAYARLYSGLREPAFQAVGLGV